jgi:hypothetical protein
MARPHRSRSSPRLSDEELDYYGDLYVCCSIRGAGVDFETFLRDPDYYLQKHARGHPAVPGALGEDRRRGLRSYLRLRQATRTPSE